jgi:putative transposase
VAFVEFKELLRRNPELYEKSFKEFSKMTYQAFINEEFDCLIEDLSSSGCHIVKNGIKKRKLKTYYGEIELSIPQLRNIPFQPSLYEPYSRVEKTLASVIQEMFLQGVSTRKTREVLKQMGMDSFDKSSVSRLTAKLSEELNPWLKRDLSSKEYPYLMVDARYEKIRVQNQVLSHAVYIIVGIDEEGYRDILSVSVGQEESYANWKEELLALKQRGIKGVNYLVSDQHQGLVKAIQEVFLGCKWQRCSVHYQRNFRSKIAKKDQKKYEKKLSLIWSFSDKDDARDYAFKLSKELEEDKQIKASEFIEESIEDSLSVYDLPSSHRRKMKSTNMLERFNQELKRRSRVVRIFPNESSCLRLLGMISKQQAEQWLSNRRYLDQEEMAFAMLKPSLLAI